MIKYITDKQLKKEICSNILRRLPEWFSLEEGILQYAEECKDYSFWAYVENDEYVGFAALKETSSYTVEIAVMGVVSEYQNKGIGSKLFKSCYSFAKENGYEFIQVKTVKKGKYKSYDLTNSFYIKLGFKELECIDNLWDKNNPCQIYVMSIR